MALLGRNGRIELMSPFDPYSAYFFGRVVNGDLAHLRMGAP